MQTSTRKRPSFARALRLMAMLALWMTLAPLPASAQRVPPDNVIEIVIKRHLMTFNDANLTGNYEVWHAMLSRPFRQQFTADQLKTIFDAFHSQKIDIAPILAERPVLSEPAHIDAEGALALKGAFETRPSRVTFDIRALPSDGEWRLLAISVDVVPVDNQSRGGASGKAK